jgi:hypothetical protein
MSPIERAIIYTRGIHHWWIMAAIGYVEREVRAAINPQLAPILAKSYQALRARANAKGDGEFIAATYRSVGDGGMAMVVEAHTALESYVGVVHVYGAAPTPARLMEMMAAEPAGGASMSTSPPTPPPWDHIKVIAADAGKAHLRKIRPATYGGI